MRPEPWAALFKKADASVRVRPCRTTYDPARRTARVSLGGRSFELMICPKSRYRGPAYKKTAGLAVCVASGTDLSAADQELLAAYLAALEPLDSALAAVLPRPASAAPQEDGRQPLLQTLALRDGTGDAGSICLLSLSMRCNQACLFCPVMRDAADLPRAAIMRELASYCRSRRRQLPGTGFLITGGEPTLSPVLKEAVRFLTAKGAGYCTLLSNAVRLSDPAFLSSIQRAGVQRLFLSFHSHRPEVYDALTGTKGQFRLALDGIRQALRRPFFEINCNVVVNKLNYKDFPEMAAFLAGLAGRDRRTRSFSLCVSAMNENPA
ncbi:MAG: radical SAM protein, partial [Elusimicrobiota bacterium]